ncbi:MAG: hypothetical protein WCE90_07290 [Candidatus Zixiibacteriota bacterium]
MALPEKLKSKKLGLGLAAIVVIAVGFLLLKFMTSGGNEVAAEKANSAPRTDRAISRPKKDPEPAKTPLYQVLKEWKDPFRGEDPKLLDLQDKIDATKKEIELLKASLEEKKLRQEIGDLESSMKETPRMVTAPEEKEPDSTGANEAKTQPPKTVSVLAILITDDEKSALLVSGERKTWVHQGEEFDGWEVKEIREESVVLFREGKTFLLYYDRPGLTGEGES